MLDSPKTLFLLSTTSLPQGIRAIYSDLSKITYVMSEFGPLTRGFGYKLMGLGPSLVWAKLYSPHTNLVFNMVTYLLCVCFLKNKNKKKNKKGKIIIMSH